MPYRPVFCILCLGWSLFCLGGCSVSNGSLLSLARAAHALSSPGRVVPIPLPAPLDRRQAEISGLAWCGNTLLLLPQYPNRMGNETIGRIFGLDKEDILAAVQAPDPNPVPVRHIPFDSQGIENRIPGFEGYEALTCGRGRMFLNIEARGTDSMCSYLVSAQVQEHCSHIQVLPEPVSPIPAQADIPNMGDEVLLHIQDGLLSIYEANGRRVNPEPVAHRFTLQQQSLAAVPFPHIEYRVTDATAIDSTNRFWVLNFYYPGDRDTLRPVGQRSKHTPVERLIELQLTPTRIVRTQTEPISLRSAGTLVPRNWEGVARLDSLGFLVATDKYPATILGFIPTTKTEPQKAP